MLTRNTVLTAAPYGLRHTQYEMGPDVGGGSTVNVVNRIWRTAIRV